jgi:hypothetical protein
MIKKETEKILKYKDLLVEIKSRHFRQNFSAISRPYFHLPLLGSLASLQTLEASFGESWNALHPWFSSKLGV